MESPKKPRLDARLVFAVVLVAIPLLYVVGQVILVRSDEDCGDPDHSQVGGISQMFIPGEACPRTPRSP
jgi:hypothetical protein